MVPSASSAPGPDPSSAHSGPWSVGLHDVLAGLSVAFVLIPQSLAYADLAGLPPYYGLYAAFLPPIAAALFVSSPYLQTGPVAITSLLTLGALASLAAPQAPSYVGLAALLALVVGVARIAFGLIRAGWVAYLMSQPVLRAFTAAAAILIAAAQLPTALGVAPDGETIMLRALWAARHPGDWELASVVLSAMTIGLVLGVRRLHALFPGVVVAVVVGLGFSAVTGYDGPVVGAVRAGLPPFSLALPWAYLPQLLVPGFVIALVGFAEPAAIARIFAAQDRRRWSPDREFISQGVANLAAGVSGAFPVGGSFSRSSLNRIAGGRSRWSGAVTGLAVLAFMPVAGVLSTLPRAVLGAIVIAAVLKLIDVRPIWRLVQLSRPQAGVAWLTFGLTIALAPRIERAVLIGIGLSALVHLWRELRVEVNARFEGTTLSLGPRGVLFFASAPGLEAALIRELAEHPNAERLVIDLGQLGRIDYTGALVIKNVVEEAAQAGLAVEISNAPPHTHRILGRVLGPSSPFSGFLRGANE
jgi:SulP family sulfate permease